ncbi:MAG: hypothetical protein HBSAPP04_14020 [Ignavibacteriaceae bacterium]|nr:MAG: hypothetical protein EDM75_08110 [Chlorobiota bacterium]GJQ32563.1 MAG: hypothetical protein HBSAPP04_14020 [Ignavibacteriaceae bacterium]
MNTEIAPGFLPAATKDLFEKFSKFPFFKNYILVGGTALSLRAGHRESEDLDFISIDKDLNITSIKRFFSSNFNSYKIIRLDENYQIDLVVNGVKVTFFSPNAIGVDFDVSSGSTSQNNIIVASIETIAVLKINAISQRNTMRDYYDLYYIAKNFINLRSLIETSKKLLPNLSPIIYSETLLFVRDIPENSISSHLKPTVNITKAEIAEFFRKQLINQH